MALMQACEPPHDSDEWCPVCELGHGHFRTLTLDEEVEHYRQLASERWIQLGLLRKHLGDKEFQIIIQGTE